MFANDGHADAKPEPGPATGTLGSVKGIEDPREGFRTDAYAVILDGNLELVSTAAGQNLESPRVPNFADGLFSIGDQVQKNLNQLVGVANNAGKIRLAVKFHFDIVVSQGVFLQLKSAFEKVVEVERPFLRRGRA